MEVSNSISKMENPIENIPKNLQTLIEKCCSLSQAEEYKENSKFSERTSSLPQYLCAIARATLVCRIAKKDDTATIGTGFSIAPGIIITNYHVLGKKSITQYKAVFSPGLGLSVSIDLAIQLQPSSPDPGSEKPATPKKMDYMFIELANTWKNHSWTWDPPMPIGWDEKLEKNSNNVHVIGHPDGCENVVFSDKGNTILEYNEPSLDFDTYTLEGSSGSPVFNRNWKLIALFRAGAKNPPPFNEEGVLFKNIIDSLTERSRQKLNSVCKQHGYPNALDHWWNPSAAPQPLTKPLQNEFYRTLKARHPTVEWWRPKLDIDLSQIPEPLWWKGEYDPHAGWWENSLEGGVTYCPLQGTLGYLGSEKIDPMDAVQTFIGSFEKKIFLLHGESGGGKTWFARWLQRELLVNRESYQGYVPLYISLSSPSFPHKDRQSVMKEVENQLETQNIAAAKNGKILFIFDGYNEIDGDQNLYHYYGLSEWKKSKFIFISTTQHLIRLGHYKELFITAHKDSLMEVVLNPWQKKEGWEYIQKAAPIIYNRMEQENIDPSWSEPDSYLPYYKQLIDHIPLFPLHLKLFLETLPQMSAEELIAFKNSSSVLSTLYLSFAKNKIARWAEVIRPNFKRGIHMEEKVLEVQEEIAFKLFLEGRQSYSRPKDINAPFGQHYFPPKSEESFLGCIVATLICDIKTGKEIRDKKDGSKASEEDGFIHPSFRDYFVARKLLKEIKEAVDTQSENADLLEKLDSKTLQFELLIITFLKQMCEEAQILPATLLTFLSPQPQFEEGSLC